ncbi:MAG TPA: hypothetical protein VIJ94_13640 [Caulobacteraceae bacterium]
MTKSLPLAGQVALIPLTALGLRAHKGGAVAVALAIEAGEPRVLVSGTLETSAAGDRLSLEPYRVAAEMPRDPQGQASAEAAAAVAEGRRRQDQIAAGSLQGLVRQLEDAGGSPVVAALLVNRAGWVTDLLSYSLAWPEHAAVADGLAVREALRFACGQCAVEVAELDEKSLPELASKTLGLSGDEIDARLKALGEAVARPWRKEQKLACVAAWVAIAGRR